MSKLVLFLKRFNQKIPRIIGMLNDKSEAFEGNEEYRWQIIGSIWNEELG
jgi:hypothetical protein